MKDGKIKSSIFAGLTALILCCTGLKQSSLTDIAKTHTGVYECKSATLGDKEYMEEFSYIRLELNLDDSFSLYYCVKDGKPREQSGKYAYDKQKNVVCLSLDKKSEIKREFPLEKGVLLITLPVGVKTLIMKFEQN